MATKLICPMCNGSDVYKRRTTERENWRCRTCKKRLSPPLKTNPRRIK